MEIIVTGAAGYIGAHVAAHLLNEGYDVIGVDNFSTGFRQFIDPRIRFIEGDVTNFQFMKSVLNKISNPVDSGVVHCAGLKFAGESVKNPMAFYEANALSTLSLLKAMKIVGITNLVFSSSCSVYGSIRELTQVDEATELQPISPYGRSKLFAEWMIRDSIDEGWLNAVSLRYFNVVGNGKIPAYDKSKFNLFPNIYRAIENGSSLSIFGNNHASNDGTCVRDYLHVTDLAKAHKVALNRLATGARLEFAYNLGSGSGFSVMEVIQCAFKNISNNFHYTIESARKGDPAVIRASIDLAARDLEWSNLHGLPEMLMDGWEAWQRGQRPINLA